MEIFEKAAADKLRFATNRGMLTVEDLYDLNLKALDELAKGVNAQLKEETQETFIPSAVSRKDENFNELRLDILKHIIGVKVAAADQAKNRAAQRAHLARLKEIAGMKADEHLSSQSLEELHKQIAEIEAQLV